jgi:putative addiction module component (TIGR02574 family)
MGAELWIMSSNPAFDFRHLSIAERLQLVEDLWDSIAQEADADTFPLTDTEKALLDERLAEHERNPGRGSTWEEVKARILKRGS